MSEPITHEEELEMRRILAPWFGQQVNTWRITPTHYELLGTVIEESRTCTRAMHLVPRPYDMSSPANWASRQVRQAVRRYLLSDNGKVYVTCMRAAAYKWATPFKEASFQ